MSVKPDSDEGLMALLSGGDQGALAELVRRYQNDIFRFCLHYVRDVERAKEMSQETFIRVYVARSRFDASRKFRPWLLCIARNLCLNEIKRKKAVAMESLEEYASTAREESGYLLQSSADGPDQMMMAAERRKMVADALAKLDPESREIVTLRFYERMQARDIAEVVGSTEGAVRTRLHRILKSMRSLYVTEKDEL
ncbi:MAG: sigma-70 family RNA polymerase sigma factor [Candidatus Hydrogenedentes bacterium]|nr:sigma-70 family RNA polymerase sigma factor [Candidatus Hydrogenedentota bacterium]